MAKGGVGNLQLKKMGRGLAKVANQKSGSKGKGKNPFAAMKKGRPFNRGGKC
jgi:hypothetical protein